MRELGALELLQMFGRSGRPQYDAEGDAYLLCPRGSEERLLAVVTARVPIESQMRGALAEHHNAEIAAGPPPPLPRTKWTRRIPHPVLIGHAASLTPY
jgi:replicative superfamily II helicase